MRYTGAKTIDSDLKINGDQTISGNQTIEGNQEIQGNLKTSGSVKFEGLASSGQFTTTKIKTTGKKDYSRLTVTAMLEPPTSALTRSKEP